MGSSPEKTVPSIPAMLYEARTLEYQSRALADIGKQLEEVKAAADAERVRNLVINYHTSSLVNNTLIDC